jgi:hypothetical protein
MDPATYQLLEGTTFVMPIDPDLMAIYPQWAAPTMVKMIHATFLHEKNYFLSYKNIARACFRMSDTNIGAQFKVSNTPALMGWNSTMFIINILNQLQDAYGKPTIMTLFQNNVMSRNLMAPTNSPEMLFYRIEQCQEIQRIGKLPYSYEQIIANVVRILIQANIFPLKEFDTWEAMTPKTSSTRPIAAASRQWRFAARPARTGMPTRQSTTSWRQGLMMIPTPTTTRSRQSRRQLR